MHVFSLIDLVGDMFYQHVVYVYVFVELYVRSCVICVLVTDLQAYYPGRLAQTQSTLQLLAHGLANE